MTPIPKFPEIYGVGLGIVLGFMYTMIGTWSGIALSTESVPLPVQRLMMIGGAFTGLAFGVCVRIIYLLPQRRIPYGFITTLAFSICIPIYLISLPVGRWIQNYDFHTAVAVISSGIVFSALVAIESWRSKPPAIKVPEVYGFFVGAFLGLALTVIETILLNYLNVDSSKYEGSEMVVAVVIATGGAVFGIPFGVGIRLIYRKNLHAIPFRLVTCAICLPLYTLTSYHVIVRKDGLLAFWTTITSPLMVLLVLGLLKWVQSRWTRAGS